MVEWTSLSREKLASARRNLEYLVGFMARHRDVLSWVPPKGGFTVFPRYSLRISSREFCRRLVEEQNVLLLPGETFGIENHFRLGLGRRPDVFEDGLGRLEAFLASLNSERL